MPEKQPAAAAKSQPQAASQAPEEKTDAATELSAAEVAKKLNTEVTVIKTGKDGPVYDRDAKRWVTETRKAKPEDILSHRVRGDALVVVTVDGKKHQVAA